MDKADAAWVWNGASCVVSKPCVEVGVLRVWRDDATVGDALGRGFGIVWPVRPNSMAGSAVRVAWLAPGAWAIFAPPGEAAAKVIAACHDRLFNFADVSAGRSLWRISGPRAADLVASACSIDVHPKSFVAGRCAQSLFAQVPALIMPGADVDSFEVLADASFDGHLMEWFGNSVHAGT